MHSINTLLRQNLGYSMRNQCQKPVKSRVWGENAVWHLRAIAWHYRVVYSPSHRTYLVHEQFWGRAVRASCDSLESGALLNFWARSFCCRFTTDTHPQSWPPVLSIKINCWKSSSRLLYNSCPHTEMQLCQGRTGSVRIDHVNVFGWRSGSPLR